MASYTTNLNLKKPAGSENVAIGDINNNMDAIDTAYGTLNSKTANQMSHIDTENGTFNGSILTALAGLNNGDMKMYLNTNNPSDKPDDNHKWGPLLLCRISQQRGFVLYFDSAAGTKIGYSVDMSTLVWT